MLCNNPFSKDGLVQHGCGQCMPCRVNHRRLWTHRIILESYCHPDSCFVTLTYDPKIRPSRSLSYIDPILFLKRLRWYIRPKKIRYFLVGEYGDISEHPHYHAALFGLSVNDLPVIKKAWTDPESGFSLGFVHAGTLTFESAQYVAGYVTKKMTNKNDPKVVAWLNGRLPEKSWKSQGLGRDYINVIAETLTTEDGVKVIESYGNMPPVLSHGSKKFPLGRYLKNKLRERLGYDEEMQKMSFEKYKEQMRFLREEALSTATPEERRFIKACGMKDFWKFYNINKNQQKIIDLEAKQKLFSKKGKI